MSHTNAWTDSIPLGSELAKNIDDQIRQLRLDIHERMDDIVADWEADPVVLQPGGSGSTIIIPCAAFNADQSSGFTNSNVANNLSHLYVEATAGNPHWFCGLAAYAPIGAEIIKLEWLIDRGTAATVTTNLWSVDFTLTPGIGTQEHTMSTSAGAIQIMDSGAISVTIDAAKYYSLEFDQGNTGTQKAKLYAVRVTLG